MHYEGNMIRPPSEANSILLQVTVGCSHNKCTFCGAYKGERFKIKPMDIIMEDIKFASQHCQQQKRLFLCDGDAMIISQKKLPGLLKEIKTQLPWVNRVGTYANAKSLKRKTLEELKEMKELGLGIVYMGLESGDDETLANVQKKGNANDMIEQGRKVKEAGIKLSITVLLGLAGPERSFIHARETGRVLSAIDPEYVGALSLMLTPNTPLYDDWRAGKFELTDAKGMLVELGTMIAHTDLSRGLFFANHASNYLPIKARLPKEKEETIRLIEQALDGKIPLKPEMYRAL
ncbi:MAG: radical SAM protein [Proteobacteria bacterium]|nr:radical SAM protein [Pseudomonadota bacterium]